MGATGVQPVKEPSGSGLRQSKPAAYDVRSKASLIFPEQYPEAAATLARAFVNDPAMCAVLR
jgi:hypothetical protein